MTRLTSDVSVVSDGVVTILPSAVAMVTRLVCAFAALFSLDRMFSLILLSGGALLFVFTRFFRGKMKSLHKAVQKTDGGVRSFMQEVIENLLVVKIFDVADMMKDRSKVYQDENYYAKIKRNRMVDFRKYRLFGGIFGGLAFCDALECRKAEPRNDNLRNSHGDSSACESGANARYESVGLPAEILYHARLRRQDT